MDSAATLVGSPHSRLAAWVRFLPLVGIDNKVVHMSLLYSWRLVNIGEGDDRFVSCA